mmetsp:Transcript_83650/g.236102  ORF Transcript_83650/g.236102 Transcript_83650/m.236102 type:complete len:202 (+) Transcript_83650:1215-1820(+)
MCLPWVAGGRGLTSSNGRKSSPSSCLAAAAPSFPSSSAQFDASDMSPALPPAEDEPPLSMSMASIAPASLAPPPPMLFALLWCASGAGEPPLGLVAVRMQMSSIIGTASMRESALVSSSSWSTGSISRSKGVSGSSIFWRVPRSLSCSAIASSSHLSERRGFLSGESDAIVPVAAVVLRRGLLRGRRKREAKVPSRSGGSG